MFVLFLVNWADVFFMLRVLRVVTYFSDKQRASDVRWPSQD